MRSQPLRALCAVATLLLCAALVPQGYAIRIDVAEHQVEQPPPEKLPFRSGSIISLRSNLYGGYCNAGGRDDDPPYSLRCNEVKASSPAQGLLLIGKSFVTSDIISGGSVYLKSQKVGKFCSVGPADEGSYITCHEMHYGKDAEFVVYAAGEDGAIRMHPADDPQAWCHTVKDDARQKTVEHPVRCSRRAPSKQQVFLVIPSGGGGGGGSGGGGDYPSGGGDYPSGGGDYPSGSDDYPSGGGEYPSDGGDYPSDGPSGGGGSSQGGGSGYPSGGGDYPSGGSDPSGGSGYPSGGGDYPSGAGYH